MKFRLILFIISFCFFIGLKSLHLQTVESAVDTESLSNTQAIDIIKILNLDELKPFQNSTQEAEVLKHKLKKTDIDNFENYLNSYLNYLKKIPKVEISDKISINNSRSDLDGSILNNRTDNIKNDSHIYEKNLTKVDKKLNSNLRKVDYNCSNITTEYKNVRKESERNISVSKVNINTTYNTSVSSNNNTSANFKKNNKSNWKYSNKTLDKKENTTKVSILVKPSITYKKPETKNTTHINNTKSSSNLPLINSSNTTNINKSLSTPTPLIDKVYENLKKNKLNQDFERMEKSTEIKKKKEITIIDADALEYNIYKRIVNISLSLILVGLLFGVFLGLILVMYFNSKHK